MCSISLQYDPNNPAAVKMLDAILSAGLFTISPLSSSQSMTMETINRELDKVESDATQGLLISSEAAHQRMSEYVQKYEQQ